MELTTGEGGGRKEEGGGGEGDLTLTNINILGIPTLNQFATSFRNANNYQKNK